MGSSFVLFDVSMEITQRQFRSGKSGYTQKHPYPWENASYPWVKGLSVTTTNHQPHMSDNAFAPLPPQVQCMLSNIVLTLN